MTGKNVTRTTTRIFGSRPSGRTRSRAGERPPRSGSSGSPPAADRSPGGSSRSSPSPGRPATAKATEIEKPTTVSARVARAWPAAMSRASHSAERIRLGAGSTIGLIARARTRRSQAARSRHDDDTRQGRRLGGGPSRVGRSRTTSRQVGVREVGREVRPRWQRLAIGPGQDALVVEPARVGVPGGQRLRPDHPRRVEVQLLGGEVVGAVDGQLGIGVEDARVCRDQLASRRSPDRSRRAGSRARSPRGTPGDVAVGGQPGVVADEARRRTRPAARSRGRRRSAGRSRAPWPRSPPRR